MGDLMREGEVRDMTPRLIGDTWLKYPTEKSSQRYRYGLYECQYCGKEFETMVRSARRGHTKSCGCNSREVQSTHGLRQNRFYNTWYKMIHRCSNINNKDYKDYGGRGIIVCEEWLDVRNFVVWAEATHPNEGGYSIDRINVNGNYEPSNCRWADASTQCINQRIKKNNTSGYVGVAWNPNNKNWRTVISLNKARVYIGSFKTKEEAVLARDQYIIDNGLPHKLSTDYKREDTK